MKKVFLIAGLLVAGVISAQAQGGGYGQRTPQTPQQRADRMTDLMSKHIDGLSSDQTDKIKAINLSSAQGMDSLFTDKSADRSTRREKMKTLMDSQNSQLKTVLNDAQYKQWQDFEKQRRTQMMNRRNNGGGGNGGGDNGGGDNGGGGGNS